MLTTGTEISWGNIIECLSSFFYVVRGHISISHAQSTHWLPLKCQCFFSYYIKKTRKFWIRCCLALFLVWWWGTYVISYFAHSAWALFFCYMTQGKATSSWNKQIGQHSNAALKFWPYLWHEYSSSSHRHIIWKPSYPDICTTIINAFNELHSTQMTRK